MPNSDFGVFISYATPDRGRVIPFFDFLVENGYSAWMDCKNLLPGQDWDFEIKRELGKATFVLVFVSKNSFDRRGYLQRELKFALDQRNEKLADDIFLIPVLLDDDASVPPELSGIQLQHASDPNCLERLRKAIDTQLARLGESRTAVQAQEGIKSEKREIHESWDGCPGYDFQAGYPVFHSDRFPDIAQAGHYIKGEMLRELFWWRRTRFDAPSALFNLGQERTRRTATYDAACREPIILGRMLIVRYTTYRYGAAAAHGVEGFFTYNFLLNPLQLIDTLSEIFADSKAAFPVVQQHTRNVLYERKFGEPPHETTLDREQVDRETEGWKNFGSFAFGRKGVEVTFQPCQVSAYALGAHVVIIPFTLIAKLMRPELLSAVDGDHFLYGR